MALKLKNDPSYELFGEVLFKIKLFKPREIKAKVCTLTWNFSVTYKTTDTAVIFSWIINEFLTITLTTSNNGKERCEEFANVWNLQLRKSKKKCPPSKPDRSFTLFTRHDCRHCRDLISSLSEMYTCSNDNGIVSACQILSSTSFSKNYPGNKVDPLLEHRKCHSIFQIFVISYSID